MKRFLALILSAVLFVSLCGCGTEKSNGKTLKTELLKDEEMSKYVKLCKYKGIEIDTNDDEFRAAYNKLLNIDASYGDCYNKQESGTVKEGDIANINYVGRIDGELFTGGSADDYNLTIGSGTFIDGFEDGLIDAAIGDTVTLQLSFPTNYGNSELAGRPVEFTVKVNYVYTPQSPDESYAVFGFKSADEYKANLTERAAKSALLSIVVKGSEVLEIPKNDNFKNVLIIYYNQYIYKAEDNVTFEQYLKKTNSNINSYISQNGSKYSMDNIKRNIQVKDDMNRLLVYYAVICDAGLTVDKTTYEDYTRDERRYHESITAYKTVAQYLFDNAVIK